MARRTPSASGDKDKQAQLRALEAQFFQQFDIPGAKTQEDALESETEDEADSSEEHDEDDIVEADEDEDDEDEDEDDEEGSGSDKNDFDDDEDLLQQALAKGHTSGPSSRRPEPSGTVHTPATSAPKRRVPETVVFSDPSSRSSTPVSKGAWKQFMSSKIEHINKEPQGSAPTKDEDVDEDEADQRANDRKLSELLSTTLFAPGGTSTEGKKRKLTSTTNETLARIMELSSADTIQGPSLGVGWGEKKLKATELGKMPARIRQGLRRAAGERRDREIETQKELGLWNPKIHKQTVMTRGSETERGSRATQPKQRQRGIGSGVGKFRGGVLHLSDSDIRRIRGSHRGGSRGGGSRR